MKSPTWLRPVWHRLTGGRPAPRPAAPPRFAPGLTHLEDRSVPTVAIGGAPASVPEGTPISLTGTVTDPGVADTPTLAWSVSHNGNAPIGSVSGANFWFHRARTGRTW